MQWRALRYFDTVARCRSLRQAATLLHIAPTAVSRQIDLLEHHLGTPLIERGPDGIRLTAAGELLAAQAQRTLRDFERVEAHIADLRGLRTGRIGIQAAEGIVSGLLAPALASLSREHPRLRFDISIASAGGVIDALRRGDADIGLAFFMPQRDDIVSVASAELTHYAVMAPGHPLATAESLSLSDIAEHALALPDDSFGVRQALDRAAREQGVRLTPSFHTSSLETQKSLAMAGGAVLVLPRMAVARECEAGQLRAVPLKQTELAGARVDLCLYRHRQRSFAMEACLSLLVDALEGLSADEREVS
ncbi:LysR family transcriptional regulator [Halomonas sp. LR3S48]|uniref:LysR family transcriptional regulator n=1 Tax=Halomonadaceae TaxID=28256 RepID=UPI0021E3F018|nr:LysR family transcriptional regulator [Halomonas sp. LR3S48]UYG02904.1 LysR family transcriptional regulator [Halomonas sp. LR3S48]